MSHMFDPATAGLVVIDVQSRLWPFISRKAEVARRIIQAIEVAGRLPIPIVVTEQYTKGIGPTIPEVKGALDQYGAYKPIEKSTFSCFGEPAFVEAVRAAGLETIILVGIEGHVCVLQTALDALDAGLQVRYVTEAISSRDPHHKAEAIMRVRQAGGVISSVEMFAFEAMRSSRHPSFKAVQRIIT